MELVENPKTQRDDICRVTHIGGTGIEWICIKPVHAKIYTRKKSDPRHPRGSVIFAEGGRSTADKHFMVPRWIKQDDNPSS